MQHVANRGVGDSLIKTLQLFCSRVMQEYLQNESDCETIVDRLAEVFLAMAIKFNENQLRKVVIDYAKWAESKNDVDQDLPFNHRKIVLHSIFCCLAQKLG